jgi:hypothetical protein
VFYLIEEENDKVIIMRVLYGKQKYENLLWNTPIKAYFLLRIWRI